MSNQWGHLPLRSPNGNVGGRVPPIPHIITAPVFNNQIKKTNITESVTFLNR